MAVLLTRPLEDSLKLARSIRALKLSCFIEPMFSIKYLPNTDLRRDLHAHGSDCCLIFTSKHALRAVGNLQALRQDFLRISPRQGINNARSLVEHIRSNIPQSKILIYARGEKISLDIKMLLAGYGFTVKEFVVYSTIEKQLFSSDIAMKLRSNQIKALTFYSRNTFDIFNMLLKRAQIERLDQDIIFFVISAELGNYIKSKMPFAAIEIFKDKNDLIAALYSKDLEILIQQGSSTGAYPIISEERRFPQLCEPKSSNTNSISKQKFP